MAGSERKDPNTPWWLRHARLVALALVLVFGWMFILWQNQFDVTPPLVFVMLAYFAVVMTTWSLWRTGASAMAEDDEDDSTWVTALGARGELEREKRTLLKAIRETEFDHQMGKLSQADADQMIGGYRARAIDVLKQIDQLELGEAGTIRERILRDAKARVAIAKGEKVAAEKAEKGKKKGGGKAEAKIEDVKVDDAKPDDGKAEAKIEDVKVDGAKPDDANVEAKADDVKQDDVRALESEVESRKSEVQEAS